MNEALRQSDSPQQRARPNSNAGFSASLDTTDLFSSGLAGELGTSLSFRFFSTAFAAFLSSRTFREQPVSWDSSFPRVAHVRAPLRERPIFKLPKAAFNISFVSKDRQSLRNLAKKIKNSQVYNSYWTWATTKGQKRRFNSSKTWDNKRQ